MNELFDEQEELKLVRIGGELNCVRIFQITESWNLDRPQGNSVIPGHEIHDAEGNKYTRIAKDDYYK